MNIKLVLYQCMEPDIYILGLIESTGGAKEALEKHIDLRPKLFDVTYDNVDIGRTSSEYLIGQQDQSIHWTSSIIVEDVIDAREIADDKVERNDSEFEDRIHSKKYGLVLWFVKMKATLRGCQKL